MKNYSGVTVTAANKAKDRVSKARAKIGEVIPKAEAIYEDDDFTPEGKARHAGAWLRDGREGVEVALKPARTAVQEAYTAAVNNLEDIRYVTDEELAARAVILQPVIAAASDNPSAIINAYLKRAGSNMAERRLLEETMQAMADAEIGGLKFQEDAARARDRLELGSEEQDAISEVQYLEEAENYLNSAGAILEGDLKQVEGTFTVRDTTRLAPAYAAVNRFERETKDAGVKSAAGGRTEQDEKDAETIRKWREQQEAKRAESEASRDEGGEPGEGSE